MLLLLPAFLVPYEQIQTLQIITPWPTFGTKDTTGTAIHRFAAGFKAVYVYY